MKNSVLMALFAMGVATLTILGCTKNKTMEQDIPAICETLEIAYNDEIKTIINTGCAYSGCHDGNNASIGDFTSYQGLLSRLENGAIKARAIDADLGSTEHMPPTYTPAGHPTDLTDEEADMLLCWILDNYPEN